MGWIIRILLALAGSIAGWFAAPDALNFDIIKMVIAVILFTLILLISAFWTNLLDWFKRLRNKYKD